MKMTIEDFIQKQRDITYLKLTREVQEVPILSLIILNSIILVLNVMACSFKFLCSEDYDGKKQKEVSVLESTLEFQAKTHEKVYGQKARKLNEINRFSVKTANFSDQLNDDLVDKNVILHQRKFISEEMSMIFKISIRRPSLSKTRKTKLQTENLWTYTKI